jgi:zinc protease
MLAYERGATESPDRESANRADEYTRNYLHGEALPTIWQELAFHRRFLPAITLAEINALAADWFPNSNRLVVVTAPDAAGVVLPTTAQLEAVVKSAASKRLTAYVDSAAGQPLMDAPPPPGSIVKTTDRADAGITEWTLSNGATVVLKPTTLKEDQILFRSFAPGGTSLAGDDDFISARIADDVVPAGGVGRLSGVALDKLLNGKAVAVTPFINEIAQGMGGGSTPQDLETMFQLIYLRFTQPRADPTAFAAMASRARALLANRAASPDVVFNQAVAAAMSQNSPRRRPETAATVEQWNLEKAVAFYRARFADASGFTFVFVGSFTPEAIKPFVERYLASLPATHAHETARDLGITPPRGVVEKTIEKGIAPKSEVAIVFTGPFQYDDEHRLAMAAMALVLQSRLLDTIRQELGGTYAINVEPDVDKVPRPLYTVRIDWTSDPARTAALTQRVLDEIAFVGATRLSPDQMIMIREGRLRELETNSQQNGYFLQAIARRYEDGDTADLSSAVHVDQAIAALTADAIQQAARSYLSIDNYVKVTPMPAAK